MKNFNTSLVLSLAGLLSVISLFVPLSAFADTAPLVIVGSAITCDAESSLPNWGDGAPHIDASTALSYVALHPTCHFVSGWTFQWGLGFGTTSPRSAVDRDASYTGPVTGSESDSWNTFGPTDVSGTASTSLSDLYGASAIWVRENLPAGYIPFSEPPVLDVGHKNNVSAEMYCANDVVNYNNYDAVFDPALGNTYYCVTFNALATTTPVTATNTPPVITILGANPLAININTDFVDPGATATDTEDGSLTSRIVVSGTVSTTTAGTYVVSYSVTDSGGLSATSTRMVDVVDSASVTSGGGSSGGSPALVSGGFSSRGSSGGNRIITPVTSAAIPAFPNTGSVSVPGLPNTGLPPEGSDTTNSWGIIALSGAFMVVLASFAVVLRKRS